MSTGHIKTRGSLQEKNELEVQKYESQEQERRKAWALRKGCGSNYYLFMLVLTAGLPFLA